MQRNNDMPGVTLGAAIIVKNAEQDLARAIRSVQPVTQQIVVVDTGSTDKSPVVASRLGAEIYFCEWREDFSFARNVALDHMRTDWIIQIDADEELDLNSFADNAHLLASPNCGGIRTRILNVLVGTAQSEHSYTRIFRNDRRVRYEGRIHEQIAPSIEQAGFVIADSGIIIRHYGYAQASGEKIARNADLLREELQDHPQDAFLQYHLGLTEFSAGNFDESRKILAPLADAPQLSQEQRETVLLRLAQIALAQDQIPEALARTGFVSDDPDREGLRLFVRGAAEAVRKNFSAALADFSSPLTVSSRMVDQEKLAHFQRALSGLARRS